MWRRRGLDLWELGRRRCWKGWWGVCGVVVEGWERWRHGGICRSPVRLLRRLPLDLWWRASRLVVVSVIDGLRRLFGVCASVKLFFLLRDEGAVTRPMTLVSAMYTTIGYFLPSAGVFPPTAVGIASVAPPSSVVLRSGVAGFVTRDRVHSLWGLCLLCLIWLRSVDRDCAISSHSSLRFSGAFLCLRCNILA